MCILVLPTMGYLSSLPLCVREPCKEFSSRYHTPCLECGIMLSPRTQLFVPFDAISPSMPGYAYGSVSSISPPPSITVLLPTPPLYKYYGSCPPMDSLPSFSNIEPMRRGFFSYPFLCNVTTAFREATWVAFLAQVQFFLCSRPCHDH